MTLFVLPSTFRREIGRQALVHVGSLLGFRMTDTLASLNVWGKSWKWRQALARSEIRVGCNKLVILRNWYVILSFPELSGCFLFVGFLLYLLEWCGHIVVLECISYNGS